MTERDSLSEVLREWRSAEPSQEFDQRVLVAYRKTEGSLWNRIWHMRRACSCSCAGCVAPICTRILVSPVDRERCRESTRRGRLPTFATRRGARHFR